MRVRFWGTRGSIPSPGPSTQRYGGNTSCVEVRLQDGTLLIVDAGSGIRPLGVSLGSCRGTLLLSHYHWDHIQGMPFFGPAYSPASEIDVLGPHWEGEGPEEFLSRQMMTPYFPAAPSELVGVKSFGLTPSEPFEIGEARISTTRLSHPGNTLGYRIEERGSVFVYMSDDEVDSASPEILEGIIALASGADVLLHDCQYAEREYPARRGWGHSTPRQAIRIASAAGVRSLVLFHHDPSHSDEDVEALAEEAHSLDSGLEIVIGREGADQIVGGLRVMDRTRTS